MVHIFRRMTVRTVASTVWLHLLHLQLLPLRIEFVASEKHTTNLNTGLQKFAPKLTRIVWRWRISMWPHLLPEPGYWTEDSFTQSTVKAWRLGLALRGLKCLHIRYLVLPHNNYIAADENGWNAILNEHQKGSVCVEKV